MAFKIDELTKKAELIFSVWLPPKYYSERMGSSYLVNDKKSLVLFFWKKGYSTNRYSWRDLAGSLMRTGWFLIALNLFLKKISTHLLLY